MARLFGTDGIRGIANVDLKPTTAYALGRAVAHHLVGRGGAIVVGQDTRRSGDMFVAAIAAGATSLGVDAHVVGVVPTPALAYLAGAGHVRRRDHGLGVAQPGRRQRPQGARQRRPQARRRGRGRARAADLADRGAGRRRQRRDGPDGRRSRSPRCLPGAPARPRVDDPGRRALAIVLDCANGSGCPRRARRSSPRPAPGSRSSTPSPTGSTSTSNAARPRRPRWRRRSSPQAPMSGSRSTATPIASSPSMRRAGSWMATRCSASWRSIAWPG